MSSSLFVGVDLTIVKDWSSLVPRPPLISIPSESLDGEVTVDGAAVPVGWSTVVVGNTGSGTGMVAGGATTVSVDDGPVVGGMGVAMGVGACFVVVRFVPSVASVVEGHWLAHLCCFFFMDQWTCSITFRGFFK